MNEIGDDEGNPVSGGVEQAKEEGAVETELPTLEMGAVVIQMFQR